MRSTCKDQGEFNEMHFRIRLEMTVCERHLDSTEDWAFICMSGGERQYLGKGLEVCFNVV